MTPLGKLLRRLLWAGVAVLVLLSLAGLGAYLALRSEAGRSWLVDQLEEQASDPQGISLSLDRLEGSLPEELILVGLTLRDPRGVWLQADRLEIAWNPWALFEDELRIAKITGERLEILRPPETPAAEEPEEAPADPVAILEGLPLDVVLERLEFAEVVLGEELLGEPARLGIEGTLAAARDGDVRTELSVERRDGTPGTLLLTAGYDRQSGQMVLDLQAREPAGGLLARALSVPGLPAFDATIAGAGPLEDWRGSLSVSFDKVATARGDFTLKAVKERAETLGFALTAQLQGKDREATGPWALLSPEVALSLQGTLAPEALRIDGLELTRGSDRLKGAGNIALDDLAFQGEAWLALQDAALLKTILGPETTGSLGFSELELALEAAGTPEEAEIDGQGTLSSLLYEDLAAGPLSFSLESRGPLDSPDAKIALQSERLAFQEAVLDALSLEIDYEPTAGAELPAGAFSISAESSRLSHPALEPDFAELAEGLALRSKLHIAEGLAAVTVEKLTLENDALQLIGEGKLDPISGEADADMELQLQDIASLDPGLGLAGRAQARLGLRAKAWDAPRVAELSLAFEDLAFADPLLAKLAGATPQLEAAASLQPGGALEVSDIRAQLALAEVTGRAALDAAGEALSAEFRIASPDLSPLSAEIGSDLAGALEADIKLAGTASDPRVEGEVTFRNGHIDVVAIPELRALFEAGDLAGAPSGRIALEGATEYGPVTAESDFRLEPEALALSDLKILRKDDEIAGRISVPLDGGAFSGAFTLTGIALADWLALAEMKGAGRLTGEVELAPRDGGQWAGGRFQLSDLVLSDLGEEPLRLQATEVEFELADLLGDPRIESDIRAQGLRHAELSLRDSRASLAGGLDGLDFTLATEGSFREPLSLSASGRAELGAGEERLLLSNLTGQVLSQELRLLSPLEVTRRGEDLDVSATALRYGPAELSLSLKSKGAEIALEAELAEASLSQLAALGLDDLPEGELAARLTLAGRRPEPEGRLELSLDDLKLLGEGEAPAAELEMTGKLQNGRLVLNGKLSGLAKSAAKLEADLPLRFADAGLAPEIPTGEAMSGSLSWRGDVAEIWPLVPITGHALSGPGDLDLRLGGSLENPDLQGAFRLSGGRYENFDLGTHFADVTAEVALTGDRVELAKLTAHDRLKGRLTAGGALELDGSRDHPFAFEISMTELAVLQRDDLLAITDGDLKITGDAASPALEGKLTTRRVEITIPEELPAEVAVIEVSRAGEAEEPVEEAAEETGRAGKDEMTALLDVTVEMPRRVFVRGRGLDSEWSGNLRVTGTSAAPRLKGKLELVRGLFTAVGKAFELEKGSLEFLGGEEINPLIDLRAVNRTSDLTAIIALSGPVQNPEIALSSEPPLPRDEVLSHLLFGKASGQLSTLEAVQLAAALAKLSGRGGGGLGILDRMRRTLGVDVLRVESTGEGEDSSTAVKAGKYVTEDVYVGVTQGATAEAGGVEVEIEVTPNISIETENRSDGQSNVGVRFKWDY